MKKLKHIVLLTVASLLFATTFASAQTEFPMLINYQGFLSDASGVAITGDVDITFSLYSDILSGDLIWSETQLGLESKNGIVSTHLGIVTPFKASDFYNGQMFLEIAVIGYGTLLPRMQLTTVPFAINVKNTFRLVAYHLAPIRPDQFQGTVIAFDTTFAANTFTEYIKVEIDGKPDFSQGFVPNLFFGPTGAEVEQVSIRIGSAKSSAGVQYDNYNPQASWTIPISKNDTEKALRLYFTWNTDDAGAGSINKLFIWGK